MLGLGRASEYAGWWSQGNNIKVVMQATSAVTTTVGQTPFFSFLTNGSDRNWKMNNNGSYNFTGYSSISGFNNRRFTTVNTIYLPWSSGMPDDYYATLMSNEFRYSGQPNVNNNMTVDIASGQLQINGGFDNYHYPQVTLPGAYTSYANTWLTVVACGAETSSVYTNWSTSDTTGSNYLRIAVYKTETGELLGKSDRRDNGARMDLTLFGNTINAGNSTNYVSTSGFGSLYEYRQSGLWYSFGTMFDPLTETNKSWLAPRIPNIVGNANAWASQTYTTYTSNVNTYYGNSATGLYSVSSNYNLDLTESGSSAFTTGYSTTIVPKDKT